MGSLGVPQGSTHEEVNDKCIRVDTQEVSFSHHFDDNLQHPRVDHANSCPQKLPIKRVFLDIRHNPITSQTESP